MAPKYIVIPELHSRTWDAIDDYAWHTYRISGNDFIGCRTYRSPSGNMAIKLDVM
jgi:hypothetical protein